MCSNPNYCLYTNTNRSSKDDNNSPDYNNLTLSRPAITHRYSTAPVPSSSSSSQSLVQHQHQHNFQNTLPTTSTTTAAATTTIHRQQQQQQPQPQTQRQQQFQPVVDNTFHSNPQHRRQQQLLEYDEGVATTSTANNKNNNKNNVTGGTIDSSSCSSIRPFPLLLCSPTEFVEPLDFFERASNGSSNSNSNIANDVEKTIVNNTAVANTRVTTIPTTTTVTITSNYAVQPSSYLSQQQHTNSNTNFQNTTSRTTTSSSSKQSIGTRSSSATAAKATGAQISQTPFSLPVTMISSSTSSTTAGAAVATAARKNNNARNKKEKKNMDNINTDSGNKQNVVVVDNNATSRLSLIRGCDIQSNDVLCGRDKATFNFIGNIRFRASIGLFIPQYAAAQTKREKATVIVNVVRVIRTENGSRFLKKYEGDDQNGSSNSSEKKQKRQNDSDDNDNTFGGNDLYVELDEVQTRKKVGHALRDLYVARSQKTARRAAAAAVAAAAGTSVVNNSSITSGSSPGSSTTTTSSSSKRRRKSSVRSKIAKNLSTTRQQQQKEGGRKRSSARSSSTSLKLSGLNLDDNGIDDGNDSDEVAAIYGLDDDRRKSDIFVVPLSGGTAAMGTNDDIHDMGKTSTLDQKPKAMKDPKGSIENSFSEESFSDSISSMLPFVEDGKDHHGDGECMEPLPAFGRSPLLQAELLASPSQQLQQQVSNPQQVRVPGESAPINSQSTMLPPQAPSLRPSHLDNSLTVNPQQPQPQQQQQQTMFGIPSVTARAVHPYSFYEHHPPPVSVPSTQMPPQFPPQVPFGRGSAAAAAGPQIPFAHPAMVAMNPMNQQHLQPNLQQQHHPQQPFLHHQHRQQLQQQPHPHRPMDPLDYQQHFYQTYHYHHYHHHFRNSPGTQNSIETVNKGNVSGDNSKNNDDAKRDS